LLQHDLQEPMFQFYCTPFCLSSFSFRLVVLTDINYSIKPSVTTLHFRFDIWTTSLMGLSATKLSLSGSRPSPPIWFVCIFNPFVLVKKTKEIHFDIQEKWGKN
jgi:hypothetical protein